LLTGLTRSLLRSRLEKSFTLVELLLVVVLLGIVVGLTIPNFAPTFSNIQLSDTASNLSYLMRYAQSRAIIKTRTHRINFDSDYSKYWISQAIVDENGLIVEGEFEKIKSRKGRVTKIPQGIKVESESNVIQFTPDGRIDKMRIYLSNKRDRYFTISTKEQSGFVHLFDFKLE